VGRVNYILPNVKAHLSSPFIWKLTVAPDVKKLRQPGLLRGDVATLILPVNGAIAVSEANAIE